jgi:hypothetical protein
MTPYQCARSKLEKSILINTIVDKFREKVDPNTGMAAKFVKFSPVTGWMEIGDEQAREKVGHAIREAIASILKQKRNVSQIQKERQLLENQLLNNRPEI